MKKCNKCGYGGIFIGELCDICRRGSGDVSPVKVGKIESRSNLKVPGPGEVCPCCNRSMPMTSAQRKRNQRARQKQKEVENE